MRELRAAIGPEPSRSRRYIVWSRTVVHCAGHLSRKGFLREALETVALLDVARLDPLGRCARTQIVAATSIALGDRTRARTELQALPRPAATPLYERALSALAALLDVLEGRGAAIDPTLAARIAEETDPNVRATLRAAHAHALAAAGQRDEALAVLRELRGGELGARAIERVAMHGGPASPLASALHAEDVPPYR